MAGELITWFDDIDKQLLLLLNYDGGYAQDCCWQLFSSPLIWLLPAIPFLFHVFRCHRWAEAVAIVLALACTVALCDQISSSIIKPFVARLRPSHCPELQGLLHFVNGYRGGLYGFVSSHAANSFGAATFVSLVVRRRRVAQWLFLLALCVSYSRIYLGVHYPGDILAGAMLGVAVGLATYTALCLAYAIIYKRTFRYALTALTLCILYPYQAQADNATDSTTCHFTADSVSFHGRQRPTLLADTTAFDSRQICFGRKLDKWSSTRLYQMTSVSVPLIVGGLVVKGEDTHFRSLRNDYLPLFHRHVDDYTQYAPAAILLGMKLAGVEGRSSWGRMLVSDAFAAALMGGVVTTLKLTTQVERPDGSNNHSFPSGHTATAFMTATMLTKEYGHKSPWIGIGAYATASATGLMRMANNKHWLSDVLTGAGIGILSTELGYYLGDLIFKDKGLHPTDTFYPFERLSKPSFFSLYVGVNIPLSKYDIDEQNTFRTSSGSSAGLEGAYFFNPYVGVGGRFTVSNTSLIVNKTQAEDNTFDAVSLCAGGYFSYPLSERWLVGSKLIGGYVHYPKLDIAQQTIAARSGVCFGSGLSVTFKAKDFYGIRFFLDYNLQPSHTRSCREWMNTLTCGAAFAVHF